MTPRLSKTASSVPPGPAQVIFFYGLFMDPDILAEQGVVPGHVELATIFGLSLRIGRRATLVPDPRSRVEGTIATLPEAQVAQLYAAPGLSDYRPLPVLAHLADGRVLRAICYSLSEPPPDDERDEAYAAQLRSVAHKLGLPAAYIATIR